MKREASSSCYEFDIKVHPLDLVERAAKREVEKKLTKFLGEVEIKWAQRAMVRRVVQRDNNTQFFHPTASEKHMKKHIIQVEHDEGTIVVHDNLRVHIINFYKKLFCFEKNLCP